MFVDLVFCILSRMFITSPSMPLAHGSHLQPTGAEEKKCFWAHGSGWLDVGLQVCMNSKVVQVKTYKCHQCPSDHMKGAFPSKRHRYPTPMDS